MRNDRKTHKNHQKTIKLGYLSIKFKFNEPNPLIQYDIV